MKMQDFLAMTYEEREEYAKTDGFVDDMSSAIHEVIDTFPAEHQKAARQQQWLLEGRLRKYKNPISRMNEMVLIFNEGFEKFRQAIGAMHD